MGGKQWGHFISQLTHKANIFLQLGKHVIHMGGKTGVDGGKTDLPQFELEGRQKEVKQLEEHKCTCKWIVFPIAMAGKRHNEHEKAVSLKKAREKANRI